MIRKAGELEEGGALDRFEKIIDHGGSLAYESPTLLLLSFVTLSGEITASNKRLEDEIKQIHEKFHNIIKDFVIQAKKEKVIKENLNTDTIVVNIVGFMQGISLQWRINEYKIDMEPWEAGGKVFKEILFHGWEKWRIDF